MTDRSRPTAKDVLDAVLRALYDAREPLDDDLVLLPARFEVYVHPEAYGELKPLLPRVRGHVMRRLDEELARLNGREAPSRWRRLLAPLLRLVSADHYLRRQPVGGATYERAGEAWHVGLNVTAEPGADLGYLAVETDFAAPSRSLLGGKATVNIRRVTRRLADGRYETVLTAPRPLRGASTQRVADVAAAGDGGDAPAVPATGTVVARLSYEDRAGQHLFYMRKPQIIVGRRDDPAHFLDVALDTLADVSREHARIRRRPDGSFEIKDVSRYGVTVDGVRIPSSLEDGEDVGRWHALPGEAEIGLGGVVFIQFEAL